MAASPKIAMAALGQSRSFDSHPRPSGLPSTPDTLPAGLHGSDGPQAELGQGSASRLLGSGETPVIGLGASVRSQKLRSPLQSGELRDRDQMVLPAEFPGPIRSCALGQRNHRRTHEWRRSAEGSDW